MRYSAPLERAVLIKRYKRFLADVELVDGSATTIYCPNTGSMKCCADPGVPIWFSRTNNPKRRYQLTWEQGTDSWGNRVGLRSVLANTLVAEAIQNGLLRKVEQSAANACGHDVWLQHVERLQAEWHWPQEKVRLDFALHTPQGVVLVEVKSVTLAEPDGLGLFPDAKTERGLKQIQALQLAQQQGQRVVLVYCVQNSGVTRFSLAEAIDPAYAQAVRDLMAAGARVIALGCDLSNKGIEARRSVQVVI